MDIVNERKALYAKYCDKCKLAVDGRPSSGCDTACEAVPKFDAITAKAVRKSAEEGNFGYND